jgi:hypothetical protein
MPDHDPGQLTARQLDVYASQSNCWQVPAQDLLVFHT